MALNISCLKINDDINDECKVLHVSDFTEVGVLIPLSMIDRNNVIENGCVVNFNMKYVGGGYKIYDRSFKPFDGSQPLPSEAGTRFNSYGQLVVIPSFERSPENAEAIFNLMNTTERYVVLLEQQKVNADGSNRFICYGLPAGLKLKESKSDIPNQTANVLSLEQKNTKFPEQFYFDTNDATTIAKVDDMVNYEVITGLSIGTNKKAYVKVDSDKKAYCYMPDGTKYSSVSGVVDQTYTGIAGSVVISFEKSSDEFSAFSGVFGSDVTGSFEVKSSKTVGFFNFTKCSNIIANKCDQFEIQSSATITGFSAKIATIIYAQNSHNLSAQSIYNAIDNAYTLFKAGELTGTLNFGGTTTGITTSTISTVHLKTYATIISELSTSGWTITINSI